MQFSATSLPSSTVQNFLALIDDDARAKVFVTPVAEKLAFQDEQGCVISKTDGVPIGQIVEIKLVEQPQQQKG